MNSSMVLFNTSKHSVMVSRLLFIARPLSNARLYTGLSTGCRERNILCQLRPMREISGALIFPSASKLVQKPRRPRTIIRFKKSGALLLRKISNRTGDPHLHHSSKAACKHHSRFMCFGTCLQFSVGSTLKLRDGILCIAAARRIEPPISLIRLCEQFMRGYSSVVIVLRFA